MCIQSIFPVKKNKYEHKLPARGDMILGGAFVGITSVPKMSLISKVIIFIDVRFLDECESFRNFDLRRTFDLRLRKLYRFQWRWWKWRQRQSIEPIITDAVLISHQHSIIQSSSAHLSEGKTSQSFSHSSNVFTIKFCIYTDHTTSRDVSSDLIFYFVAIFCCIIPFLVRALACSTFWLSTNYFTIFSYWKLCHEQQCCHKIEMTDKIVDSNGSWLTNSEVNGFNLKIGHIRMYSKWIFESSAWFDFIAALISVYVVISNIDTPRLPSI